MIEIDGVRLKLEHPTTEAGDYISDEYLTIIDLSTSPDRNIPDNLSRIVSATRRLNLNLVTTSYYLVGTEFAKPYERVVEQLNSLNADIEGIETLQPLIEAETRFSDWSGSFKRAG